VLFGLIINVFSEAKSLVGLKSLNKINSM